MQILQVLASSKTSCCVVLAGNTPSSASALRIANAIQCLSFIDTVHVLRHLLRYQNNMKPWCQNKNTRAVPPLTACSDLSILRNMMRNHQHHLVFFISLISIRAVINIQRLSIDELIYATALLPKLLHQAT